MSKNMKKGVQDAIKPIAEKGGEVAIKAKRHILPSGIIWPKRKECWIKTLVVTCVCALTAVLLIAADTALGTLFHFLVG